MKAHIIAASAAFFAAAAAASAPLTVAGPDGRLEFAVDVKDGGVAMWRASYDGETVVDWSALGLETDAGDFTKGVKLGPSKHGVFRDEYSLATIKKSRVKVEMNTLKTALLGADGHKLGLEARVGKNDIAFRYSFPKGGKSVTVKREATAFALPSDTTIFATPQSKPMIGFAKTKPSYEETYVYDAPVTARSGYGEGWTFPMLAHVKAPRAAGGELWALISETGTDGNYCGCRLMNWENGAFSIGFPMPGEARGKGAVEPTCKAGSATPWRTVTIGGLAAIVETTVAWDVVKPVVKAPDRPYRYGKGSWSWIVWDDQSMNPTDQRAFVDLAAEMKWDHILVDAYWDRFSEKDLKDFFAYAKSKNIAVYLWYNSNGDWNDAPQTPKDRFNTPESTEREMAWLEANGVRGIKVDFWGGDKQFVIKRYCELFEIANRHGIEIFVHGSTLPRGWERMYPNFVGAEALLASENLKFSQGAMDSHSQWASLHPFCRNAVASAEFGPVFLNKHLRRDNKGGSRRVTTEGFELATSIIYQNPVQNFGLCPNNLREGYDKELAFLREVPTTWDETRFVAGYPGKYIVLARRSGKTWYVAGLAREDATIDVKLDFCGGANIKRTLKRDDGFALVF